VAPLDVMGPANIRFADSFTALDLGAQIAAADTDLDASAGQIWVTSSGTISTAVNLRKNHDLICVGSQVTLTMSTSSSSIVQSSHTRVKGCTFSSSLTIAVKGEVYSQNTTDVGAEDLTFIGGGTNIQYSSVTGFTITNPHVVSMTAPTFSIEAFRSIDGQIISPQVEDFTWPATADGVELRAIVVMNSSKVEVIDPVIRNIDATRVWTFGGVSFWGSTNSSLVGGILNGLKNGDGVVTEKGSADIDISGTQSFGNSPSAGAGVNANDGDGFDIFNSARVHLSACNGRGNGIIGPHHNIEIFTSTDVTVQDCDASDGAYAGVAVVGSPRTKLLGITANRNQSAGLAFTPALGTVNTYGTSVTFVSGESFGMAWAPNTTIIINSGTYKIASVSGFTSLTLTTSAGTQTGVTYSVDSYDGQVIGGEFSGNGLGLGVTGTREGVYLAGGTTGLIQGITATDPKAMKTQTYGIRLENSARAVLTCNSLEGNLDGAIQDSVGESPVIGCQTRHEWAFPSPSPAKTSP